MNSVMSFAGIRGDTTSVTPPPADLRDGGEIGGRVEGRLRLQGLVDDGAGRAAEQQRVAIGLGSDDGETGDRSVRSDPVVHGYRLF